MFRNYYRTSYKKFGPDTRRTPTETRIGCRVAANTNFFRPDVHQPRLVEFWRSRLDGDRAAAWRPPPPPGVAIGRSNNPPLSVILPCVAVYGNKGGMERCFIFVEKGRRD